MVWLPPVWAENRQPVVEDGATEKRENMGSEQDVMAADLLNREKLYQMLINVGKYAAPLPGIREPDPSWRVARSR